MIKNRASFLTLAVLILLTLPLPGHTAAPAAVRGAGHNIQVEVVGTGSAPVKGKPAAARQVALALARRDAAEKGVGASVAVEMLPDLRSVRSRVEGALTYDILHEETLEDVYSVRILARLTIPRDLAASYPLSTDDRETGTGYRALVEKFPGGEINWQEGYILAYGKGRITGPGETDRMSARRAAIVDAQATALEIAGGIRVDSEDLVRGLIRDDPRLSYRVEGVVRDGQVVEASSDDRLYRVIFKVPLYGIRGLSLTFYERVIRALAPPPAVPADLTAGPFTGLVIDARGAGAAAALFPAVVTGDGSVVYSAAMVDSDAFLKRGVVGYATGEPDGDVVGDNPLVVKLAALELVRGLMTVAQSEGGRRPVRRRRRQGVEPLKIAGLGSAGALKANLIISDADAARIAGSREFSSIFRESRVIVLTDPVIGGSEGHFPPPGVPRLADR